ncbi:MAG: hypothetical protein GQ564_21455 [Bacteroidales bacterium]|nr:hypothetical protein [Bacteroidales bacterium]
MKIYLRILAYTLLLSLFLAMQNTLVFAQEMDSVLFTQGFFEDDDALDLTLKFDIKKFIDEKMDEIYLPASLSYKISDTIVINKQVRIKSRGIVRKDFCYFPPYFLNIKNTELPDNILSDIKKVKVVSHCKNSEVYNNYILKEYLVYKIFNIITDYSFKVRLLNVKYIDTGRKDKTVTYRAFMIEPEKLLAERLDALLINMDNFGYNQTDTAITTVMSLFQYMIGNTDYSITGRHNLKLITLKDHTKQSIIPIPYDFDFSGFANTHYAKPQSSISIENVTDRYFYGMCRTNDVYINAMNIFREKKEEIFSFILTCEYLDKKTMRQAINYLEEFYKELEKPKFIEDILRNTCE